MTKVLPSAIDLRQVPEGESLPIGEGMTRIRSRAGGVVTYQPSGGTEQPIVPPMTYPHATRYCSKSQGARIASNYYSRHVMALTLPAGDTADDWRVVLPYAPASSSDIFYTNMLLPPNGFGLAWVYVKHDDYYRRDNRMMTDGWLGLPPFTETDELSHSLFCMNWGTRLATVYRNADGTCQYFQTQNEEFSSTTVGNPADPVIAGLPYNHTLPHTFLSSSALNDTFNVSFEWRVSTQGEAALWGRFAPRYRVPEGGGFPVPSDDIPSVVLLDIHIYGAS